MAAGRTRQPRRADGAVRGAGATPGSRYGPVFQGLRRPGGAATRCSPRSRCPRTRGRGAAAFGLHPALLDAALHARRPGRPGRREATQGAAAVRVERGVAARGGRVGAAGAAGSGRARTRCRLDGRRRDRRAGRRRSTSLVLRAGLGRAARRRARAAYHESLFRVEWTGAGDAAAAERLAGRRGARRRTGAVGRPPPGSTADGVRGPRGAGRRRSPTVTAPRRTCVLASPSTERRRR